MKGKLFSFSNTDRKPPTTSPNRLRADTVGDGAGVSPNEERPEFNPLVSGRAIEGSSDGMFVSNEGIGFKISVTSPPINVFPTVGAGSVGNSPGIFVSGEMTALTTSGTTLGALSRTLGSTPATSSTTLGINPLNPDNRPPSEFSTLIGRIAVSEEVGKLAMGVGLLTAGEARFETKPPRMSSTRLGTERLGTEGAVEGMGIPIGISKAEIIPPTRLGALLTVAEGIGDTKSVFVASRPSAPSKPPRIPGTSSLEVAGREGKAEGASTDKDSVLNEGPIDAKDSKEGSCTDRLGNEKSATELGSWRSTIGLVGKETIGISIEIGSNRGVVGKRRF